MAHKTLIGDTGYEIAGGKTRIGGTGYEIAGGKTRIGGTVYDVGLSKTVQITIKTRGTTWRVYTCAEIDGTQYGNSNSDNNAVIETQKNTDIWLYCRQPLSTGYTSYIRIDGNVVASSSTTAISYTYKVKKDCTISMQYNNNGYYVNLVNN